MAAKGGRYMDDVNMVVVEDFPHLEASTLGARRLPVDEGVSYWHHHFTRDVAHGGVAASATGDTQDDLLVLVQPHDSGEIRESRASRSVYCLEVTYIEGADCKLMQKCRTI